MINTKGFSSYAGSNFSIPAGGYICEICNVAIGISKVGNEMLVLQIDVADGGYKNFYHKAFEQAKSKFGQAYWGAVYRCVISAPDGNISYPLKLFLRALQDSNDGLAFDDDGFDEKILVGKRCGFVFGEYETKKIKQGNTHYTATKPSATYSIADIRAGNFVVPEIERFGAIAATQKKPTAKSEPEHELLKGAETVDNDDLPF